MAPSVMGWIVKGMVVVVGRRPLKAAVRHWPRPSAFPLQRPHAVFHVVRRVGGPGLGVFGFWVSIHLATVFFLDLSRLSAPLRPAGRTLIAVQCT